MKYRIYLGKGRKRDRKKMLPRSKQEIKKPISFYYLVLSCFVIYLKKKVKQFAKELMKHI